MLDLSRLSAEQRRAVTAGDGPLLVVAGPGSGKTTVLAARIAYLVALRGVSPTTVLALTFATKAARELRERLGGVLGAEGRRVDVATFHAFGLRIVHQWAEALGYHRGRLTVLSAGEAAALLREAAVVAGWDLDHAPLADLARDCHRYRLGHVLPEPGERTDGLERVLKAYEALMGQRGVVDYAAMLSLPLALFARRPEALHLYQNSYRYVLADEFHDTCAAQYALLYRLAQGHRNLAVVADPCQAIYGWRGADVGLLARLRDDFPEVRAVGLSQNFRSTGRIVALANAMGAPLPYHRPLWTDNPPGGPALLHVAVDGEAEARFVAGQVVRLLEGGGISHPGEVAVLYRANWQAEALVAALTEHHLPYRLHDARRNNDSQPPDALEQAVEGLQTGQVAEEGDSRAVCRSASGDEHAVTLATIHAAKGGEWRVVFLVGAEEGLMPHARAVADPPAADGGLEEERRVAYVGVTRPRERLFLSCCRGRRRGGRVVPSSPSRFLRGLPVQPWRPVSGAPAGAVPGETGQRAA